MVTDIREEHLSSISVGLNHRSLSPAPSKTSITMLFSIGRFQVVKFKHFLNHTLEGTKHEESTLYDKIIKSARILQEKLDRLIARLPTQGIGDGFRALSVSQCFALYSSRFVSRSSKPPHNLELMGKNPSWYAQGRRCHIGSKALLRSCKPRSGAAAEGMAQVSLFPSFAGYHSALAGQVRRTQLPVKADSGHSRSC